MGIWSTSSRITSDPGGTSDSYGYFGGSGQKINNNAGPVYGATFTSGDVIGVALDLDAGTLAFYKNGASQGIAFSGLTGGFRPAIRAGAVVAPSTGTYLNAGQRAFAYTAPSGFKALCDTNLPAPLTAKPNTLMDVVLYTGTGAALTPTSSLGFNPDWIWIKSRSAGTDHALYDVVRGAQVRLESNTTDAEVTSDDGVTAFNSAGFTLGTLAQVNTSAATYVAWCWDAGTSTVSNATGSITSQVRANASAGFSIVTYSGNSTSGATVGHGLGVAPSLIIPKARDRADGWPVYHSALGSGKYIELMGTAAVANSTNIWNAAPTSTVFQLGADPAVNGAFNYVCYCFAPVVGYSSFGSYTGNGSADGPFVYTGFRPRFVLLKGSSFVSNWHILDAARNAYNVTDGFLRPNLSSQEFDGIGFGSGSAIDILSNGFKLKASFADSNTNAASFVYAAFAESPFQYARAR